MFFTLNNIFGSENNTISLQDDATSTIMFANNLLLSGDFYQASGEYQRFIFFYPKDERVEICEIMNAYSHNRGRQFTQSNILLQNFLTKYPNSKYKELALLISMGNLTNNTWNGVNFDKLTGKFDTSSIAYQLIEYIHGWKLLERGQWYHGREQMRKVINTSTEPYLKIAANRVVDTMLLNPPLQIKSVQKAVNLSKWLPGAGQWSLGNKIDGTKSFVTTAGFTYIAYDWFKTDFRLGAIFMLYEGTMRFYNGGKYNTAEQAKTINNEIINNAMKPYYQQCNPQGILDKYLVSLTAKQELITK